MCGSGVVRSKFVVSFNSVHYVLSTCVSELSRLCTRVSVGVRVRYKFTGVTPNDRGAAVRVTFPALAKGTDDGGHRVGRSDADVPWTI